jgi:excinuclease ABC subunit C
MAVFVNGKPAKDEYRKFRIRTIHKPNDVGMLEEILRRRFQNSWPLPDLILIDGGAAQANVARKIVKERGMHIPILGIAKGPKRRRNDIIGIIPKGAEKKVLIRVRDEAHRFAISYHRKLRGAIVGR